MALSFNDSVGVSYDADQSYFDGPDPITVDLVGEAIASAEAFGTFVIDQRLFFNGVASSEAFGTLSANHILSVSGISAPYLNLLLQSESVTLSPWTHTFTATPDDIIAPDGTMTGIKIEDTSITVNERTIQYYGNLPADSYHTFSFYAKQGNTSQMSFKLYSNGANIDHSGHTAVHFDTETATGTANNINGDPNFRTMVAVGDGWYRVSVAHKKFLVEGNSYGIVWPVQWVSGGATIGWCHVWGFQLDEGSVAKPYRGTTDHIADAVGYDAQINHQLLIPAIASTEAFGTSRIDLQLEPVGIPSGEAHGVGRYSYPYDATPTPWNFDNDPGTFDGTEFWQAITFFGIASAEAFGTLEVKFGFSPVAIPSEEAFGTPRANLQVNAPASIPSLEAFGSPQINHQLLGQGFVDPTIFSVNGQVIHRLDIVGIPSEEAFGTQYLGYSYDGAPTPWSFDNEIITFDGPELWQVINFLGFISEEAFGLANFTFPVYPAAINSLEAFGSIQLDQSLPFTGIESTEAFGGLRVDLPLFVSAIPGQEALGTPNVLQAVNGFAGISSAEAFGTPFLSQRLFIVGIASTEAFGTFEIRPVWESVDPVLSSWSGVSAQVTVWSEVSAIGLSWSALSPIASVWSPASSQTSAWGVASSQSTSWSALESVQASWVPDSSMSLTWTPVASVPKSWTPATPALTTWSKAA